MVLTVATIVTVAVAPLARGPKLQLTVAVPLHVPTLVVVETHVVPAGRGSLSRTFCAVAGPLFPTVIVQVALAPTASGPAGPVFVTETSATCVCATTTVVTLALLLPGTGSVVPAGAVMVAVLTRLPVNVELSVAVTVKVRLLPLGRSTATLPLLPAGGHVAPPAATQVQAGLRRTAGNASASVAPATLDGPAFANVTTYVMGSPRKADAGPVFVTDRSALTACRAATAMAERPWVVPAKVTDVVPR